MDTGSRSVTRCDRTLAALASPSFETREYEVDNARTAEMLLRADFVTEPRVCRMCARYTFGNRVEALAEFVRIRDVDRVGAFVKEFGMDATARQMDQYTRLAGCSTQDLWEAQLVAHRARL